MSTEVQQPAQVNPEAAEPKAGAATVPVVLLLLPVLLLYLGLVYFDRNSGWFSEQVYAPYHSVEELTLYQPPTGGIDLARGKAVFDDDLRAVP